MTHPWDEREYRRLSIDGEACWSAGRIEGSCTLKNLSAGGVEISNPHPPLKVGTRLHVALFINQLHFDAVLVEVVRVSEGSLGLQFVNPEEDFQRRIDALISELVEKSE
jgi:hypothetical protein